MPKEKTESKSIRMSPDQYAWIQQAAKAQGISQAEVITQMIQAVDMGEMAQAAPDRLADINTFRNATNVLNDLYRSTVYAEQHAKEIAKEAYVNDLAAKDSHIVDLRAQCDSYASELKTAETDCKASKSEAEIAKAAAESARSKIAQLEDLIQSKDHSISVLQAEVADLRSEKSKYEVETEKLKSDYDSAQKQIFSLSMDVVKLQTSIDFFSQHPDNAIDDTASHQV